MKKILSILILITILFSNSYLSVNAEDWCAAFTNKKYYSLFRERVKCICNQYKPQKELKYIEDEYEEVENEYVLSELKLKHKTDMNDIYKCALLSSQKKALLLIRNDLIKFNADLYDKMAPVLDDKIMLIDLSMNKLECKNTDEKN